MSKRRPTAFELALEEQITKLKVQNEALKDQVRHERRRANKHADEVAVLHEIETARARRRNEWRH